MNAEAVGLLTTELREIARTWDLMAILFAEAPDTEITVVQRAGLAAMCKAAGIRCRSVAEFPDEPEMWADPELPTS